MIRYAYFTRAEAIKWQKERSIDPNDPLTDLRTSYCAHADMDQPVGVGAWDGERMIGRNFFFHIPISVRGRPVECVVTNNLFVAPEYRPQGIGTYLKMYVLKLGYPQISSGVSPAMQKVYNAWNAYRRVDSSPTYSLPTDLLGLVRVARIAVERSAHQSSSPGVSRLALSRLLSIVRLLTSRRLALRRLKPRDGEDALDSVLHAARRPVQVPWNRSTLVEGLHGRHATLRAWIVEFPGAPLRLVTGYIKRREVRTIGKRTTQMTEFLLNEVWPPLEDETQAKACLAFAVQQARALRASVTQVDAMTEALRRTCQGFGFDRFYEKRVYIAPNTKDRSLDETLSDPANWWCRAINENEFEELALRRTGATDFNEFVPLNQPGAQE